MAYGQTGSGKTFTMMGTKDDPGVNVRSIRELLKICGERDQVSYSLKVRKEVRLDFWGIIDKTAGLVYLSLSLSLVDRGLNHVEICPSLSIPH